MSKTKNTNQKPPARTTRVVSDEVFKQVYDSPHSLPGKEKWVTTENGVSQLSSYFVRHQEADVNTWSETEWQLSK